MTRRVTAAADVVVWVSALAGVVALLVPATRAVLGLALAAGTVLAVGLAWPTLRVSVRVTAAAMIAVGATLSVTVGVRQADIEAAFVTMCTVFSFVAVVRLLELPVLRRERHVAVARTTRALTSGVPPVWSGAALTGVLCLALSFGAIPLAYRSVRAMDADPDEAGSVGVVSRAFITANLVAPLSPPLAVALAVTGLTWLGFLPYAAVLFALSLLLVPFGPRPRAQPAAPLSAGHRAGAIEFAAMVAAVLAVLVVAETAGRLGHAAATVLAVLLVVPVWDALTGGGVSLWRRAAASARAEAGSWREQFVLFGAGGFVVAAATRWTAGGTPGRLIAAAGIAPWALLAIGAVAITALALAGLYPLTGLIVVATVLTPLGGGSWPALVAAAALVGALCGFVVSPFSGMTLLVSALSGRSPFDVALRWNLPFGMGLLGAGVAAVAGAAVVLL